ncbi:MAG: hypothetical protein RL582_716, partial [Bacteroidota bacterium]
MQVQQDFTEVTFHPDHSGGTKKIWRIFWVLSILTIVELALGYFLYAKGTTLGDLTVLSTKVVIGVLTL